MHGTRHGYSRSMTSPVVLHIPHASTLIPPDERRLFALTDDELALEVLRITDWYTDELVATADAARVIHPVSRLVVDPERFEDDEKEPMAKRGMGATYTHGTFCQPIRCPLPEHERRRLMTTYYRSHHDRLERSVEEALAACGWCLIVDMHSFPDKALPFERDPNAPRLDYDIGTDEFHTPPDLTAAAEACLHTMGRSCSINRPFAGTIVPMSAYRKDRRVMSLMIEVNRRLYMDEATAARLPSFNDVRAEVGRLIDACRAAAARL